MARENHTRRGCKDVFNAFLVSDAEYDGNYEFPILTPTYSIPNKLISFQDALKTKDYNQWIHFFTDDNKFEEVWRYPRKYLSLFRRFNGVILPDFSVYRDMPLSMQIWNIYRSRAIGYWLQKEGVNIIVNIRYGDERTYDLCCDGIARKCVIAVGSHGTIKTKDDKYFFLKGLDKVVENLQPTAIVVYGSASDANFFSYKEAMIPIHQFESDFSKSHNREVI